MINNSSIDLPEFVSGQTPLTADRLNQAIGHANSNRTLEGGPGIEVTKTPTGHLIARTPQGAIGEVKWFSLVTTHKDHHICGDLVPDGSPEARLVASNTIVVKPEELRQTKYDGKIRANHLGTFFTYTYTDSQTRDSKLVTDPSDVEAQVVIPHYIEKQGSVSGSEILAIRLGPALGIVVTVGSNSQVAEWLEFNIAGRAWAHELPSS